MYKTHNFADIIIVIIGTLTAVIILIFPLFFSVSGVVSIEDKTARFTVAIFGVKVFKHKAQLIFSSLFKSLNGKNPFNKIPKISVLSVNGIINTWIKGDVFLPVIIISALSTAKNALFNVLQKNKPHLKLNLDINVYNGETLPNLYLKVNAVINIIDAIKYLFKIISEKLYNVIGKKQ